MPFKPYDKNNTAIAYYVPKWTFYFKTTVTSLTKQSTYWDITNSSITPGTPLEGNKSTGKIDECFNLIGYFNEYGIGNYRLISRLSGFCLVPVGSNEGDHIVEEKMCGSNK